MRDKKIVAARRQTRNLKSLLFKPRFDTSTQQTKGSVLPCKKDTNRTITRGRPCMCCDHVQECTTFQFKNSNEPFELRYHFTCDSRNLLYALTCQGCGENYIGKTERELRNRCTDYRTAIQSKKFTQGVHEHISKCGNGQFVITPFLKIHDGSRDSQTILSYETLFIQRYRPRLNVLKLWTKLHLSALSAPPTVINRISFQKVSVVPRFSQYLVISSLFQVKIGWTLFYL